MVDAGRAERIPVRGIVIALAVASQESGFKVYANDGHGGDLAPDQRGVAASLELAHDAVGSDHGSLGLFQQQWPWWGSLGDLMDPATSARIFYTALLKVPRWQDLPLTVAAQRVQRSAYPNAYADDESLARRIYARAVGAPVTDLALTAADTAWCTGLVASGTGSVVYPVPADLVGEDRRNWGGTGAHWASWHTGTDFSVPCGTPVLAAHPGLARIDTTQSWAGPQLVKVSAGTGRPTTWYAHMRTVFVHNGEPVTVGQQIGEVGREGNATGCHLHFEVHTRGGSIYGPDNVDPSTWLTRHVGKPITPGAGTFVIATFNTLGHSHTAPGGDKQSWADSGPRTRGLAALLARQAPEVIGLQEFQGPQAQLFAQITGSGWARYGIQDNVILWRRTSFTPVSTDTVAIPYFHGHPRQMPVVRLRHLSTGQVITVIDVHNPADVHGPAGRWRAAAIAAERAVVTRERAAGRAVFLIGDLNDRAPAYCALTQETLMTSASTSPRAVPRPEGSKASGCRPPARSGIDWIFGTTATFSIYAVDHSPRGSISDHPYVEAVAHLTPVQQESVSK